MEIPSYDEILTALLDEYDSRIAPETIERNDGNIIYKFATAIAKTFERTNSILDATQTPFNPLVCTDEQLQSLELITQIRRIDGKASGLEVVISNPSESAITIPAETLSYQINEAYFTYQFAEPAELASGGALDLVFISHDADGNILLGAYPVTEQASISVTGDGFAGLSDLRFSCHDNSGLLGRGAETDAEYRQRLSGIAMNQDAISYMRDEISALPYIFDCQLVFNNTQSDKTVGSYVIHPFRLGVFIEGGFDREIADIIYNSTMYLTERTSDDSVEYRFANPALSSGGISIWVNPFERTYYDVSVSWTSNTNLINPASLQARMESALKTRMNVHVHRDYITESELYNILNGLDIEGVTILNVDLLSGGIESKTIKPDKWQIAMIGSVIFERVS